MTTLLMVRHGQASFGADDYDVLSPLGIAQSRRLGAWLARNTVGAVMLWSGPLRRQIDTARHMLDGASGEEGRLPEPEVVDGLRELPGAELVRTILPRLGGRPPDRDAMDLSAIDLALEAWANARIDVGDFESFPEFEQRVGAAIETIVSRSRPDICNILVTSTGPIVAAARRALNMAPGPAIKLGSVVANSGISQFRVRDSGMKMLSFNSTDHLESHEITYI